MTALSLDRTQWALVPACFPFLICLVFTIAYWTERYEPVEATVLAMMLLPVLTIAFIPRICWRDRTLTVVLGAAVLLVGWMAGLQLLRDTAIHSGWWRICERAGAFTLFLYAACGQGDIRRLIGHLGAASAITAVVVLVMNHVHGYTGSMQTTSYAFGHVNVFANTVGPALWAWWALLLSDPNQRRARLPLLIAVIGTLAYVLIAVDTGRRGAALGLVAAVGFLAWLWLWRRSRSLAVILAAVVVAAALLLAIKLFSDPVPSLRNERIALYRAGWHTAVEGFPWGYGHYGALQVQQGASDAARHLTATGSWGTHIHCEPLDVLLDGGPVALALVAIIAALTLAKLARISDPGLRRSAQVLMAAVGVHLVTDNVYGTEAGQAFLGLAVGIVWGCPGSLPTTPAWLMRRGWPTISARWVAWPLVLGSIWGATHAIYPAVLHREAYPSIHVQCLRQALDPTSVQLRAIYALMTADPPIDQPSRRNTIDWAVGKMGWTPPLASADVDYWIRDGRTADSVPSLIRLLRFNPFSQQVHQALDAALHAAPEVQRQIPPRVLLRLAWLTGSAKVPAPALDALSVADIDAAVDAYAVITRAIVLGSDWSRISGPLEALVCRYGDVPDVAALALRCAIAAPESAFPWMLGQSQGLIVGFRIQRNLPGLLAEAETPAQARAVGPLLAVLYAPLWSAWDAGRTGLPYGAETNADYLALLRVHGLAKRAALTPPH